MDRDSTSILLALDVETAPSTDSFEFIFEIPQPTEADVPDNGRLKDPIKIDEWKKEKLISMVSDWEKDKQKAWDEQNDAWRKQSLVSYQGKIICMSYAKSTNWKNIKTIDCVNGEKEMLEEFYKDIKPYGVVQFLAANAKFDLLFLYHRALHFGLFELADCIRLDKGFSKYRIIELMDLASGGIEFKYRISLDNICKLLGVKSPKGNGIDGSKVCDMYLSGRLEEIKEYNRADVSQLIECYQILK